MFVKSIKYLVSLLVSLYLFTKISKEIYINFDELQILIEKSYLTILIIIIFIPIFYLLTIKLQFLIKNLKIVDFMKAFNATIIAYTYNLFLPAKTGDFFRHKYLNINIKFKSFFKINVIEKLISLLVLLIFVYISLIFSSIDLSLMINVKKIYVYLFFLLFFGLILYFIRRFVKNSDFKIQKIFNLFLFDISIWLLQFIQIYLIVKILNVNLEIFDIILIFGLSIIAGLAPISIGGFGVRDYVIFIMFNDLNIDVNMFVILFLFNLRYILPVLVGLIFSALKVYNSKNL